MFTMSSVLVMWPICIKRWAAKWMVILCCHNVKNIIFGNFDFLAAQGEKLWKQVVYE